MGNVIWGNTVRNETPRTARQFHFCEEELFGKCETRELALAYGEFGENKALLRVQSSMLALSPWYVEKMRACEAFSSVKVACDVTS